MIEKMTLEQFQLIRDQLMNTIIEYEGYINDPEFDKQTIESKFIEKYVAIQNQLLNYDLSDIPFEAWKGFGIYTDETHSVDFSKTMANIDFDLVEYDGNGNFRGCNVRNLEKLGRVLNPKDFDEETVKKNLSLFLSDSFSEEFKNKYYNRSLTISDLAALSNQQLDEIKQKGSRLLHMEYQKYDIQLIKTIGLDKSVQLYQHSLEEYAAVSELIYNGVYSEEFDEFIQQIKNADISEVKNICFDYFRESMINSVSAIIPSEYPESFVRENSDIFLVDANIPDEVKERYFCRRLKIQDLLDYPDVFNNIPVDNFMMNFTDIARFISDNYGMGKFQKLVQKHPDVFLHVARRSKLYEFSGFLIPGRDLDSTFTRAVKEYFLNCDISLPFKIVVDGQITYNVPEWLSSMNFQFVERLSTTDDLLQYNESVFVLDDDQRRTLNTLNIDNIRRFEQENGFFTHKKYEWESDLAMFRAFSSYFRMYSPSKLEDQGIDFKNGNLSYEEFLIQFANCLDHMRKNNVFTDYPDYDWIQGEFRNNHPEIFMDLNAPDKLKTAFYKNKLKPGFLREHKEYIPYLVNRNLSNILIANIKLSVPNIIIDDQVNFIDEYVSRYGNEKFLQLCVKYGALLSDISIRNLNGEIENEQAIEKSLRNAIYNKILKSEIDYSYLASIPEMVMEYPEIFANFDNLTNIPQEEIKRLTKAFYTGTLSFDDIKKYPELTTILKDKNLQIAFGGKDVKYANGRMFKGKGVMMLCDLELLKVFGNESFLKLCSNYGRYMNGIILPLHNYIIMMDGKYVDSHLDELSVEDISRLIENIITKAIIAGNLAYRPEDAPVFLKETHPELFLDEDAPEELKNYFYNYDNNYPMSFKILQKHKDWIPFLKGKALDTSLLRNSNLKHDMMEYLKIFGKERAIKLGINMAETVDEMLTSYQVRLMKSWYDRTGGKFIPDFVVMQNFRLEEADKFLASGSNWSNLMRIKSFSRTPEARAAMLKLAYSFGAFDQDQRGFKKLQDLLTGLPRKIDADKGYILDRIDEHIEMYTKKDFFFTEDRTDKQYSFEEMFNYVKNNRSATMFLESDILISDFIEVLRKEKVDIDYSKSIFKQLYKKNNDGTYTLTINQQSCPETSQIVRTVLENYRELPILTPNKAHQLFGGFVLLYDADFREFLLANMDKIMKNPEYVSLVASVQKQFADIKAINSNRALTWELAVSYVQTNKFTSVNVGNERVAEISAIAGYSQADFNILQQIYNYGKQRTFSSIPRIEKTSGKYTYEMLRLDDPLAMAIGTLTDCCQELNDDAEVCMEHSMVDKNGRVFVIRDEQGKIVAQSWVWRNKDVLCFDNIEIPARAFARATKESPELGRKGFTDEVYEIYKQAAHDLIEEDEKVYRELLESEKITQEQYDGLRLGKVTVGLGWNDIAESIKQNSEVDKGIISRPLPFEEPVKLNFGLYTSDSTTQYVLEKREDRIPFDGETLPVYSDSYIEYNDSNFTEEDLFSLSHLEVVTKRDSRDLEISFINHGDSEHLVTEIAMNYGLNPETTRIIMHPNFAIIYDINDDRLRVGDLLFNTKVENEQQQMDIENKVVMQMRLAFEQIASDKKVNISDLDENQKEMYLKITQLTDEMDIERGIGHVKK